MAVVINEFEILDAPKPSAAPAAPPQEAPKVSLSPQDVQRVIRHESHRAQRVRAH